jgi:hypothetical protein
MEKSTRQFPLCPEDQIIRGNSTLPGEMWEGIQSSLKVEFPPAKILERSPVKAPASSNHRAGFQLILDADASVRFGMAE